MSDQKFLVKTLTQNQKYYQKRFVDSFAANI